MTFRIIPEFDRQGDKGGQSAYSVSKRQNVTRLPQIKFLA